MDYSLPLEAEKKESENDEHTPDAPHRDLEALTRQVMEAQAIVKKLSKRMERLTVLEEFSKDDEGGNLNAINRRYAQNALNAEIRHILRQNEKIEALVESMKKSSILGFIN
ncbi:uncharacterized protein LOC122506061 [Leptopilina heterotoma]|uniref:uncharacterized protein LOC122506061 n=1 Tax=Leptopilina heterotoma TaxID=63436 RepID=UPI001CA8CEE2|nr:uncharacterized protein LOC122506061 [Leptopilina heterotoma]